MYRLFSVDDHIVEPPGVWVDRVPAAMRERVPHVVEVDGRQMWEWEGGRELTMGLNAVAGKPPEQWGMEPYRYEDMIAGRDQRRTHRPADRLVHDLPDQLQWPSRRHGSRRVGGERRAFTASAGYLREFAAPGAAVVATAKFAN